MKKFIPSFIEFNGIFENWDSDEIESTGEYADKTIGELIKMRDALRDKKDRSDDDSTKLRQLNFAIRAKRGWKGDAE